MKKRSIVMSSLLALVVLAVLMGSAFATNSQTKDTLVVPATNLTLSQYVDKAKENNQEIATAKDEDIATTITFSKRIDFSELEKYIDLYSLKVSQIELRGLMPNGERVTLASRIDKGLQETELILQNMADDGGFELVGIIGLSGLISADKLDMIQNDEQIFLADTSSDEYFQDEAGIAESKVNGVTTYPKSLAWELEDLGIIK